MRIRTRALRVTLVAFAVHASARYAAAQAPTLPPEPLPGVGLPGSALGPSPGAGASPFQVEPGADAPLLGGRPGPSVPRVPGSITEPGGGRAGSPEARIRTPAVLAPAPIPLYGTLALPERDDEGPPGGLTLDQAIEWLVRENLELRSKAFEIPQAQADILTASLRANPILYADSQLIPYGQFSKDRPGGPTQFDINITLPLDVTRKRRARTEVACRAKKVLEAQYMDAVRVQIDNLCTAYVDVLATRETVRFSQASAEGLTRIAEVTRTLKERGSRTEPEVQRVLIQRNSAQIGQADAEEGLRRATRTLAALLNMPPESSRGLELRGSIRDTAPPPPLGPELAGLALAVRPDVAAYRLGMSRAEADVKLARANRYSDVYLLVQPYTFQNNAPFDTRSAHSWAIGATVPLPVYNRNQGNIERARLNVMQTQTELATLQRQVVTEVEQAEQEFQVTRAAVARIESELLTGATKLLSDSEQLYRAGEIDLLDFLNAQRDYNDVVRQYRDTLVRHRRSMLRLNTAVGQRILP